VRELRSGAPGAREEHPHSTIEEAALAASSLIALTGPGYEEATTALRAMADRGTRGLM
jgi:hypothetical protein